mmetsp:Transcript_20707/g.58980  ORF Transcript_20707/g.58980 Transcript_20707/m.58980 type:complete len:81 (-) Transcript_20707:58-300(-)
MIRHVLEIIIIRNSRTVACPCSVNSFIDWRKAAGCYPAEMMGDYIDGGHERDRKVLDKDGMGMLCDAMEYAQDAHEPTSE